MSDAAKCSWVKYDRTIYNRIFCWPKVFSNRIILDLNNNFQDVYPYLLSQTKVCIPVLNQMVLPS